MTKNFSAVAAAFAFVGFAKSYPSRSMKLLAWGMVPSLFLGLYQPVGLLLAALTFVLLPAAWWRLLMGRADGRTGFPFRLGVDEGRLLLSVFLIHGVATLAVLPVHLIVTMAFRVDPYLFGALGMVNLAVVPALVWARLGPSLPLSVAENRLLVMRSWRPTGQIGWKLYLAWLPIIAAAYLPVAWPIFFAGSIPVVPEHWVWVIALAAGIFGNFGMAVVCATQAYVACYIQDKIADAPAAAAD